MKKPPIPKKIKKTFVAHEDERIDWYHWLRDDSRQDKEVLEYLSKENKYTEYWFKSNNVNSKKIFQRYKKALPSFEIGFKTKIDNYEYYSTSSLSQEHRKYYQQHNKKKKLILDVNKFAKGEDYYDISSIYPSRNHKFLAFGEDKSGRREFSIIVKDINQNKILEKNECSSTGTIIWNKSSSGYFYLTKDPNTLVTDSLYFHKIGENIKKDRLIYKESDKQFNLSISLSRTKKYIFLQISKTESNEIRYLDLNNENLNVKCFLKRKNKHLYYIDDTPENFLYFEQ